MRFMIVFISIISFISMNVSAAQFKTIGVDGDLSDWDAADLFYSDSEIDDGSVANAGYSGIYVANDNDHLYVGLAVEGTGGGSIANAYTRQVFLDTDVNSGTGFNGGWMTGGYDYLVQYGSSGSTFSVFSFNGVNQATWGWAFVDTFAYSFADSAIEWEIDLADLGSPSALRMQFNVTGTGGSDVWANSFESGVKTYTLAVPEPASLGLVGLGLVLLMSRQRRS